MLNEVKHHPLTWKMNANKILQVLIPWGQVSTVWRLECITGIYITEEILSYRRVWFASWAGACSMVLCVGAFNTKGKGKSAADGHVATRRLFGLKR